MSTYDDDACILTPQEVILSSPTPPTTTQSNNHADNQRRKSWFVLEPAVFFVFFGLNLSAIVIQNQIIYTTCTTIFHYNETDCTALLQKENENSQDIKMNVEPYVAKIMMTRTLIEAIIPAVTNLLLGSWSDKFGRKPVILSAFTGFFLGYVILSVISTISLYSSVSPWLFILSAIPVSILGGNCALISGVLCYITDVTFAKDRAYRMVVNEAAVFLGLMSGSFLTSYLLAATNALTVLICSGLLYLMAIIYVSTTVHENLESRQLENTSKIRGLFQFALIKDMFKTCFEKRPSYDRTIIWLTMFSSSIQVFTMAGNSTVFYLFVIEKFGWTIKEYTLYDASSTLILIFGNVIGVYILQKYMKISIISLSLLALSGLVLDSVIKATAIYSWQLYVGIGIGLFRGISGPMSRAILSHVAPATDIGKIFSLTSAMESISPLISAPLYTMLYSSTITYMPGAFSYLSSSLYFLCYIFMAIIFGIQISNPSSTYEAIG